RLDLVVRNRPVDLVEVDRVHAQPLEAALALAAGRVHVHGRVPGAVRRSRRGESRFSDWYEVRFGPSGWPPLVKISGRCSTPSTARLTTSSEWPSPYWAAVSIQLSPSSSARLIAAHDSPASCSPPPHPQ